MTRARETSENARQAKAWVNFDGTFGSSPFTLANGGIRSAFNVSSVADLGTGHYDINFEQSFANNYYSWAGSAGDNNVTGAIATPNCVRTGQMTTDKIRISVNYIVVNATQALYDYDVVNVIIFGD